MARRGNRPRAVVADSEGALETGTPTSCLLAPAQDAAGSAGTTGTGGRQPLARQVDDEVRDEQLGERADRERVQHRRHAERAAQDDADQHDRDLDRRCGPHRPSKRVRRTSAVMRPSRGPGPRRTPMYAAVATALSTMPATANAIRGRQRVDLGEDGERRVDRDADDDHVRDGPDARSLAKRDPGQQHEHADDARDDAEAQVQLARDALVQHVPRHDAELRSHEQPHRHAVQHEAEHELDQPARHPTARGRGGERRWRGHRTSLAPVRRRLGRTNSTILARSVQSTR